MKIYTRSGDQGDTGLFRGGRVAKDSAAPSAYGDVDEAQAAIGLARAYAGEMPKLHNLLTSLTRDLYVVMADLATNPTKRDLLEPGASLVTAKMVSALEKEIDKATDQFDMPTDFVIPGHDVLSASLDLARTVVRRAERSSLSAAATDSLAVPYLNRLSDLIWALARWVEQDIETAKSGLDS